MENRKHAGRLRGLLVLLTVLLIACGAEEATPTSAPATATTVPATEEAVADSEAEPTAEVVDVDAETEMLDLGSLTSQPWQWVSFTSPVDQFEVETPERYRVRFNDDGKVAIVADCNNAAGSYSDDGGALTITIGPSTQAACPPGSLTDEFITYLGSAARYSFEEGNLYVDLMADGGTMVFAPSDNSNMVAEGEGDVAENVPRVEFLDECFAVPPENATSAFELDYECGYVIAPEFYHQTSSRELKIPFMRFSSGQGTTLSPLLVHPGGPGASQLNDTLFPLLTSGMFDGVITKRDIIFMDPRGTEHSDTFLDCPGIYSLAWQAYEQGLSHEEATALQNETLRQCINDLKAQGINFDAYNSVELAGDVNAVRQALGYERIVYYGTSYGSQLGQHIMREYPEILEAVILDGSNSLSRMSWVEDRALDVQFTIDNLVALCQDDDKCREAYPDIPGLFDVAFQLFDDGPATVTYEDPDDPSVRMELEITSKDMAEFLFGKLADQYAVFAVPYLLNFAAQRDQTELVFQEIAMERAKVILSSREKTRGEMAYLMHLAVVCSDDPVKSPDEVITEGAAEFGRRTAAGNAATYVDQCQLIGVHELPDSTDENVTADIPTLLLSGGVDIRTPAARAQIVADALPNATHVIFPATIHVQLGQFNMCAAEIYTQFIADPNAELDTSCLDTDAAGIALFILPDGTPSKEIDVEGGG